MYYKRLLRLCFIDKVFYCHRHYETKLKVLFNISKQFRQFTQYLQVLEKSREIDVWKTVYFKKAAGLYMSAFIPLT